MAGVGDIYPNCSFCGTDHQLFERDCALQKITDADRALPVTYSYCVPGWVYAGNALHLSAPKKLAEALLVIESQGMRVSHVVPVSHDTKNNVKQYAIITAA